MSFSRNILRASVASAVVLAAVLSWRMFRSDRVSEVRLSSEQVFESSAAQSPRKGAVRVRRVRERPVGPERRLAAKPRPDFSQAERDEDVRMSPVYSAALGEMRAASDADDWKTLAKVVQKLQATNGFPDKVPVALHQAAIEALRWFGPRSVPELVGYLSSSDEDVVDAARDAMADSVGDPSLGDEARSRLLLAYAKVVTDEGLLDAMMMEIDRMRPTVKADTVLGVFDSGNAKAVAALQENMEFLFCENESEIVTRADVEAYRAEAERAYAEDPLLAEEDERLYGGGDMAE